MRVKHIRGLPLSVDELRWHRDYFALNRITVEGCFFVERKINNADYGFFGKERENLPE